MTYISTEKCMKEASEVVQTIFWTPEVDNLQFVAIFKENRTNFIFLLPV